MMTKDLFVKKMKKLEWLYVRQNNFIEKMEIFCSSNFLNDYFDADSLDWSLSFIEEVITGKNNTEEDSWLIYFICECNCDFESMQVEIDDKRIKIENWGDVYDFLISIRNNN